MMSRRALSLAFLIAAGAVSSAGAQAPAAPAAASAEPYAAADAPAPPAGPASAPHTRKDWDALAKLPDWGGIWVYNFGPPGAPPVLTDAYVAKVKATQEAQAKGADANRTNNCLAPGMPLIMSQPYNVEFTFSPGRVTMVQEAYMQVRRIFTDGRVHPDGLENSFNGHSIGHWEGETLVVDSVGFKPTTMLNYSTGHSDQMHIVERLHLTAPDTLVDEMTIDDPQTLAKPWSTTLTYMRHREWDQLEFICEENNRNPVDQNGKTHFILRDDPNAQ